MSRLVRVLMASFAALLLSHCGGDKDPLCTPGSTNACLCPTGQMGAQVCNSDGSGYEPCQCQMPPQMDASTPAPDAGENLDAAEQDTGTTITDGGAEDDTGSTPEDSGTTADDGGMMMTSDSSMTSADAGHMMPDAGNANATTAMVGPSGGMVQHQGAQVAIPAGALAQNQMITITTTNLTPAGTYSVYSAVYRFEPAGLQFAQPINIQLPFTGDARLATLFWSRNNTSGYERLGGEAQGNVVVAEVSHFSTGFIANGVNYADPPDLSCVEMSKLDLRTTDPSAVGVFFTVDDCYGRPITNLQTSDFTVLEDSTALGSEASFTVLPRNGLQVFTSLVLDMSSSTQANLQTLIDSAKAFVNVLQVQNQLPVQIDIQLFSGSAALDEWHAPSLDTTSLLTALDNLGAYTPTDASSTNLYGAVTAAIPRLEAAQTAFEARNYGGAFTAGYLVLFTDGADSAGRVTLNAATTAIANTKNQVVAVGLQTPDFDAASLAALASTALITAPSITSLQRDFEALATRIIGQVNRTYLFGYCSPKRSGTHTLEIKVATATNTASVFLNESFNATGFGPGCGPTTFTDICLNAQCGGFGCGACDDQTTECIQGTQQCRNFCDPMNLCGGTGFTNPRGYAQTCANAPHRYDCGTPSCEDTTRNTNHCGTCGMMCTAGAEGCMNGACTARRVLPTYLELFTDRSCYSTPRTLRFYNSSNSPATLTDVQLGPNTSATNFQFTHPSLPTQVGAGDSVGISVQASGGNSPGPRIETGTLLVTTELGNQTLTETVDLTGNVGGSTVEHFRQSITNQPLVLRAIPAGGGRALDVFVNGTRIFRILPSGTVQWIYDSPTNSVTFQSGSIPATGATIEIRYGLDCL